MALASRLLALAVLMSTAGLPWSSAAADGSVPIRFTRFDSAAAFGEGAAIGTMLGGERLVLTPGEVSGTWTSPPTQPGFSFSRLVASWNADTPADSHIEVAAQASTADGTTSGWYVLGTWAADDHATRRTSTTGQSDAAGRVATDTLSAGAAPFVSYVLRVRLVRAFSTDPTPTVRMLGAQVSQTSYSTATGTSLPLSTEPMELNVPRLSQEIHAHQYPQWGGGGEAWCSPTSTEMVIEFWGRGPGSDDLAWVDATYADPSVDFAARSTYDAAYRGTGNWPFNTAYAGRFGLDAFVTQLRSLTEAERFVRAGIPVVTSIATRPGELDGFLFPGGTSGHLVVLVGFDAAGNPVVNDPAAWTDASVRRVYDRAQFERVWLRGSGGTAYIIHPAEVMLPPTPPDVSPNW